MSIEAVRAYMAVRGRAQDIQEFSVSSATVSLAALALGVEGQRIAKTLSFHAPEGCILVVAAGDARIDNAKFRQTFGMKAKMLSHDEVKACTGHDVGGVCPFAVPADAKIYLDRSLQRFDTVFPACGSANSAIQLTCDDLYTLANAQDWVDVCRIPAPENRDGGQL